MTPPGKGWRQPSEGSGPPALGGAAIPDHHHGVRATAWIAIFCALGCVLGVFLPAGQLQVGGRIAQSTTSRSLYQIGKSTDSVESFLAKYRSSSARKLGAKALDKIAPKLPGRIQDQLGDVQDANATIESLKAEDIETVGAITAAVMWSLLGLNLILVALLVGVQPRSSRLRLAGAVVMALVTALLAVAVYVVLDQVVLAANEELGRPMFTLRGGAYVMPVAGVAAFVMVIITLVLYVRARGRLANTAPAR